MLLALVVLYYHHCITFTLKDIPEFISLELLKKSLRNESIFIGGNWGTIGSTVQPTRFAEISTLYFCMLDWVLFAEIFYTL